MRGWKRTPQGQKLAEWARAVLLRECSGEGDGDSGGIDIREVDRTFSVHPATLYRVLAPST